MSAGKGLLELRIAQEKRCADLLVSATSMSADVTNEWDDTQNATPITDVNTGKAVIRSYTGLEPNSLVIAASTYQNLCVNKEILDRIKYISPAVTYGSIPLPDLARVFGLANVFVIDAVYDSSSSTNPTVIADVFSNEYAVLCRTATNPNDLSEPCVGRTFVFEGDQAGDVLVESYRDETVRSNIYRVRHFVDEALVMDSLRYRMSNITT